MTALIAGLICTGIARWRFGWHPVMALAFVTGAGTVLVLQAVIAAL